ncbi:MAG: DUF4012 domain-containing protein [Patescibacteria group bacterium]|nr:DUF4012 domain-containing protein [Patescibacteria group bacterium]
MNNFNKNINDLEVKKELNYFRGIINVFLFLFFSFLFCFLVYSFFVLFKINKIYSNVNSGQKNIEESLQLFKDGDFSRATLVAQESHQDFLEASQSLDSLSNYWPLNKILFFQNNFNDFKYLTKTAEILSSSAEKSFFIAQEIEDIVAGKRFDNFLEFSEDEKRRILKLLYENSPELNGIKANVDLSLFYLEKAENNSFLSKYVPQIKQLKEYLNTSSNLLSNLASFSAVIPSLAGYPEPVSYLIVLQNNNELRATGGFIGSYGVMELSLGDIIKLETNDVYHLDMPASLNKDFNVLPPEPIKKYLGVDRWFMRDSNWSPDFPTSAKKIKWFYEQEMVAAGRSSELIDVSGLIAITPRMITDLLYITGPVEVDGQTYDKDNFVEVLQYEVEMAFREEGVSEWNRKNIIGDIVKEIKIKLFNLPSEKWLELMDVFNQNIDRKNFLVYLFDDYKREVSQSFAWEGEVKKTDSDFLMVIDSNLAAFKTDRVMEKNIFYSLEEKPDGIFSQVDIYYKNNGWFDWQTTRYRTYTRVYIPKDSQYLEASGLSAGDVYSSSDNEIENPKGLLGAFISIEPGEQKILSFQYSLADSILKDINDKKYYSLQVQKQAGSEIQEFKANLKFQRKIIGFEGEGDILIKENELTWTNKLDKDYKLKIYFE